MNPTTEHRNQRWSGGTMEDAVTDPTGYAEKVERTPRTVRRWKDGRHPSWLTGALDDLRTLHESGGDIWRVVSHVRSFAKWLTIRSTPTHELVERWVELTNLEHDLEAEENRCIASYDGAAEEILADEREAAIQEERAAVRRELEERRVNPRDHTRSNGSNR